MELKIIYFLSGVLGASMLTTLSVPQTIIVPVPEITISSSQVPQKNNSFPFLPGKLALSETQQERITKVNWEVNFQIDEILTIEQQKEFKNALNLGLRPSSALNTISISQEQKKRILDVFNFAQQQIENILTPEQLDYIQKQQPNRFNNKQPNSHDVILQFNPRRTA
jgi:hypothetical protein